MCKNREYAETVHSSAAGDEEMVLTAQWILGRIRTVRRDYMLKRCYNVMDRTAPDEEARDVQDPDRCGN